MKHPVRKAQAEVSAFEAKTHLSELLREVEQGRSFLIRRHGKAIARLVPAAAENGAFDPVRLAERFRRIRAGVRGRVRVKSLIESGRRR